MPPEGHSTLLMSQAWEGLTIDDCFCMSSQHRSVARKDSLSFVRRACFRHSLPGSMEKSVVAEELFKAVACKFRGRSYRNWA